MSQEVSVPLTIRSEQHAAPKLWFTSGQEIKLGCSRCPELQFCGGLSTEAPLFDCMALCCNQPQSCTRYACPKQKRYSNLVNEVGGLELHPYLHRVAVRGSLPPFIPFIVDRGTLVGPLEFEAVALSLYSIIDSRTGVARFSTRQQLLEHFRLAPRTKVIVTATKQDRSVEHFWHVLQNKNTARSLLQLQPSLVTTPNFSMHIDTVRHDNLVSMARIAYCFEAFAAAGLPVAPHINGRTPFDFERWIAFLQKSPHIHTISYELGTAGRSEVRRKWHAEQLARVAQAVQRPITLLLRAGSAYINSLSKVYERVIFVDSTCAGRNSTACCWSRW